VIFSLQFFAVDVAAEVEITKVSALTGRSFFGDSISATYYKSGAPYSLTFSYFDSFTNPGVGLNVDSNSIIPTPLGMAQYDFVVYRALIPNDYSAFVDSVVFNDFYLRFGDYARGGFALSCRLNNGLQVAANNALTYPNNYCGSFGAVRANSDAAAALADYYGTMYFSPASGMTSLNFRPIYYNFDNGGVMDSLQFESVPCYTDSQGTVLYFIVICPYIGSSMSGEPPAQTTTVVTTTDNSAGTTVIVDVDMTETNSLLGQIKQALLGIVEGITNALKDLFIPDEEFLDDFKEDMLGTDQEPGFLEEHLGGLYQAIEAIGRIFDEFPDAVAATTIDIPVCQVPLAGETLTLGPYSVPLIVEGIPQIFYDGLKFIIDFLCVAAFLNMCRNKLEIFLNPDSEVVQNDS